MFVDQCRQLLIDGRGPDVVLACVGHDANLARRLRLPHRARASATALANGPRAVAPSIRSAALAPPRWSSLC